jgi:hypothetical protein
LLLINKLPLKERSEKADWVKLREKPGEKALKDSTRVHRNSDDKPEAYIVR